MARARREAGAKKRRATVVEHVYAYEAYAPGTLRLEDVDLDQRVADERLYDEELAALEKEAFALQIRCFQRRKRAVFVFEGWDAAGKGGCIQRLTSRMDPRGYKVWPISAPKDEEARHHYLWRFWMRMPEKGEVAIFDRSWYGRVLVERVEGYAKKADWKRAYDEINVFEKTLTDDGVGMAKFWIHIDRKTQLQRFEDREKDPVKRYKIGPDDWRNRERWKDYEAAVTEMFDRTHRPDAKWHIIPGDDKKLARLEVLRRCAKLLREL